MINKYAEKYKKWGYIPEFLLMIYAFFHEFEAVAFTDVKAEQHGMTAIFVVLGMGAMFCLVKRWCIGREKVLRLDILCVFFGVTTVIGKSYLAVGSRDLLFRYKKYRCKILLNEIYGRGF